MPVKKNIIDPPATLQNFPIVGIGASAGGLDAFKRLIKAIPEDSGMAYVLVQHLDPSHESTLPEILSRTTSIPVNEITDDIHLAPDHIYVIPPNKTLTSIDGVLKLTVRDLKIKNLPIDIFFTSLAEVHQGLAVGVVLSGTGSDGTLGLKAIKEYGGVTFAQEPQSAAYDGMPQSAVSAEVADFILPPEKIPDQLIQFNIASGPGVINRENFQLRDDEVFKQILFLLRQRSGVDFTYYKQPTLRRRIARRIAIGKIENLADYLKFLRNDKAEQDLLFQDLLIPVTAFFRDTKTFRELSDNVFPVFQNRTAAEPIRVWVAACSTGEEVYSLAIGLHESIVQNRLPGKGDKTGKKLLEATNIKIQIFASDISEIAIKKARAGIYSKADVEHLSDLQRSNYFTKFNGQYEVNKVIRDMCVFAPHNFLKDPPFAKMDLISCRNVLIYMDTFLQRKALTTFHYALKENGYLLLGRSETTGPAAELFIPLSKHEKIYTRKSVPGRFMHVNTEPKEKIMSTENIAVLKPQTAQTDFRKIAEAILLTQYTPASVIVNEQMDIVHINGAITSFLEPPQGKPTFNLMKMAKEGLAFELRNAIHKAKKSVATVIKTGIVIKDNEQQHLVDIEIVPLTNIVEPHYLVIFKKRGMEPVLSFDTGAVNSDETLHRINQLENELSVSREDMRSITEDQEAANEELQSANEELQSSNEEMQSLNEELETSKEELQSTNEELIIVNQELVDKQEQLNSARLYAEAIVATIHEPLLVLDKNLRVKTANATFYKKFNLIEEEIEDKLLYKIQDYLWSGEQLNKLLQKTVLEKTQVKDFEIQLNFPELGERNMLMNARHLVGEKTEEQLILLAIEDVTERKIAEQKIQTFNHELEAKVTERTTSLKELNTELGLTVDDLNQANLQLQQFAYVASHDLQEPLRKILTFTQLLQAKHSKELNGDAVIFLSKISDAAGRMRILILDLLDYSHLSNHEKLFVHTDLNEVLKNVLKDFDLLIEQKNATVKSDRLPTVNAISLQMNQLFYNLISNALKYSNDDVAPIIKIESKKLSLEEVISYPGLNPSSSYYEIIVTDNGIGFEQKYGEKIFTIFQRLHTREMFSGTGIGLAISKKIVQNHQGEIFAKSKENKGASFHVILPEQQAVSSI